MRSDDVAGPLEGVRVLVVEDEFLVGLLIEDVLKEHKCLVLGPFEKLASALAAAQSEQVDFALLDVNVAGERVYPLAEILASRGTPFVFLSGYGRSAIPAEHPEWTVCNKPFRPSDLIDIMVERLRPARA